MNEVSIAYGLLEDLQRESKRHGVSRVSRVHVRMGSLCTVVPKDLTCAFEAASQGTVAEGAELKIGIVPAKRRCGECQIDFEVEAEATTSLCPQCGGMAYKLISGKEVDITLFRGSSKAAL